MSWAEVKKINSNMEKPLDVAIEEVKSLLTSVLNSLWYAKPGDSEVLYEYDTETVLPYKSYEAKDATLLFTFSVPADGCYKINAQSEPTTAGSTNTAQTRIYVVSIEDAENYILGSNGGNGQPFSVTGETQFLHRGECIVIKGESGSTCSTKLTNLTITCDKEGV